MAVAGQHLERAPADLEPVAGDDALERRRQRRHHAQVAMAVGDDEIGDALVEPVPQVEVAIGLGVQRAGAQRNVEAAEIGRLRREKRHVEPLAQPAGEPDVVGVEMSHDQPRDASSRKRARRQRLPGRARRLVVDAGVDHRPAVSVVEQVDVHVIELERQGDARPQNSRRDLGEGSGLGRRGEGIAQRIWGMIHRSSCCFRPRRPKAAHRCPYFGR